MATDHTSLLLAGGGWHDGTGSLTYSFLGGPLPTYYNLIDTDGDTVDDSHEIYPGSLFPSVPIGGSGQMSAAEIALTNLAVQAWNDVANVNITMASSGIGDLAFGSFPMTEDEFGTPDTFLYGFVSDFAAGGTPGVPSVHGDVWINSNSPLQSPNIYGHTSWLTYLHEIGHGLGLSHPNGDPNNTAGDATNNMQWTVMSYVEHPSVSAEPINDQGYPLTPMIYDIEAIQSLYGANTTHNSANTAYFGSGAGASGVTYTETDFQFGAANMMVNGFPVILTIWDAGGIDLIDASDLTTAVDIDLTPGSFSTIGSIADNIGLASAVSVLGNVINYVENAAGGSAGDAILGNDADNILEGNGGSDTLDGGIGDDTLIGGAGADSMLGGDGNDRFVGASAGDTIDGGSGGTDNDTIDLTGLGNFEIVGATTDPDLNSTSGTVNFLDGGGGITGSFTFREIETIFCFAAGTQIAAPNGERPVESLRIGDLVVTQSGASVPVRWIGRQVVAMRAGPVPERLEPVRIRAGALGGGLPHSDLTVTADHGMVVDGLVITAGALVNGGSIDFVPAADLPTHVTYYHIETEAHDVILANGAPAGTFIDYAGRRGFDNYAEYVELYGCERIIPEMQRPRVSAQRLVPQAIRARLGIADEVVDFGVLLSA